MSGLILAVLFAGCETTRLHPRSDFETGWLYQSEGRYDQATLYYQSYLQDHPSGSRAEEALFRLGESNFLSGEYTLALRQLNAYERRYPQGHYRAQAKAYLTKMKEEIDQQPVPSGMRPLSEREKAITELEQRVMEQPDQALLQVELANAYLDVGELNLAERSLVLAEQKASTYSETQQIRRTRQRLDQMRMRGPVYATDLYGNPGPLRISNARGELRRETQVSDRRQHNFYVVTGEVINQGEKHFGRAQVQINLYSFNERLLDTQTIQVQSIPPWGRRAFSATFRLAAPADDSVSRLECLLIY